MITPDQAPGLNAIVKNTAEQPIIEEHFDSHLSKGVFFVNKVRSAWSPENINAVLERYRAVGWKITGNGPWQFSR